MAWMAHLKLTPSVTFKKNDVAPEQRECELGVRCTSVEDTH